MQLEADVHAGLVIGVEDRLPALRELVERGLDQPRRARRPRVQVGPGERARERHAGVQAEIARGLGGREHLLDRPALARFRIAAHRRRREAVEARVVGRMHRDQLALEVRRELGDLDPGLAADAGHLVAVRLRPRRLLEIEQPRVPGRDLDALVAEHRGPLRDPRERVERRRVARELGEEDRRSLHRLHAGDLRPQQAAIAARAPDAQTTATGSCATAASRRAAGARAAARQAD